MIKPKKVVRQIRSFVQEAALISFIRNRGVHVVQDYPGRWHAAFFENAQGFMSLPTPRMDMYANWQPGSESRSCGRFQYRLLATSHWIRSSNYSRSEEHTSELQSRENLVCRLLLEKKKKKNKIKL